MTRRVKTRFKICKLYNADIWGRLFINKKKTHFAKTKVRKPRRNISIGTFKGELTTRSKIFKKRRTRYGRNLKTKQKLFNFYGSLKNYQFKKYLIDSKGSKHGLFKIFIIRLEKRLDILLYRSNFSKSVFFSRQYILHKKCALNNQIQPYMNFNVKNQNIITITNRNAMRSNFRYGKFLFKYASPHIHINYKTFELGLFRDPLVKALTFPFRFAKRRILEIYKI